MASAKSNNAFFGALSEFQSQFFARKFQVGEKEDTISNLKETLQRLREENSKLENTTEVLGLQSEKGDMEYQRDVRKKESLERKKQGLDKDLEEGLESERDKTKLMQHVAVEGKTKIDFLLQKDKEFEARFMLMPVCFEYREARKEIETLEKMVQEKTKELEGVRHAWEEKVATLKKEAENKKRTPAEVDLTVKQNEMKKNEWPQIRIAPPAASRPKIAATSSTNKRHSVINDYLRQIRQTRGGSSPSPINRAAVPTPTVPVQSQVVPRMETPVKVHDEVIKSVESCVAMEVEVQEQVIPAAVSLPAELPPRCEAVDYQSDYPMPSKEPEHFKKPSVPQKAIPQTPSEPREDLFFGQFGGGGAGGVAGGVTETQSSNQSTGFQLDDWNGTQDSNASGGAFDFFGSGATDANDGAAAGDMSSFFNF